MASIKFFVDGSERGKLLLSSLLHDEALLKSKAKTLVVEFEDVDEELTHWLISNIHSLHTDMGAKVSAETPIKQPPSHHWLPHRYRLLGMSMKRCLIDHWTTIRWLSRCSVDGMGHTTCTAATPAAK